MTASERIREVREANDLCPVCQDRGMRVPIPPESSICLNCYSPRRGNTMATMTETYNGWKNYPTWNVALWIGNDASTYEQSQDMTLDAVENAATDPNVPKIWSEEDAARFRLADSIKEWVRDELAPDLGATFAADLLGYALDEVDWDEIATNWIEEFVQVSPDEI